MLENLLSPLQAREQKEHTIFSEPVIGTHGVKMASEYVYLFLEIYFMYLKGRVTQSRMREAESESIHWFTTRMPAKVGGQESPSSWHLCPDLLCGWVGARDSGTRAITAAPQGLLEQDRAV